MSHSFEIQFPELGVSLDRFISYTIDHDFLNPPNEFQATFWLRDFRSAQAFSLNCQPVNLVLDGRIILEGIIHARQINNDGEVTITGSDHSYLLDYDIDPSLKCNTGDKLFDTIKRFVRPHGITVVKSYDEARGILTGNPTDSTPSDDPSTIVVERQKIGTGTQCLQLVNDLANKYGFTISATPNAGEIAVVRPQYDQDVMFEVSNMLPGSTGFQTTNNVMSSSLSENYRHVPTLIQAFGTNHQVNKTKVGLFQQMKLKDLLASDPAVNNAAGVRAVTARWVNGVNNAIDQTSLKLYRPAFEQDQKHTKQQTELLHLANRHFIEKFRDVYAYSAKLKGFDQFGKYWSPDTLVRVNDDACGVYGETLWVRQRTLSYSGNQFTTTIKALKPATFNLGNVVLNSLR